MKLPLNMTHPALRHKPIEELGVTRDVVAAIYCNIDMLWEIAHAFGERDGFGREVRRLVCEIEEQILAVK